MLSPSTFFLFFFLLFTFSFAELCNPNDKKALLNIKKAFNNPKILSSWKPQQDCCTWSFIKCDEKSHRVTSFEISTNGDISGQIPPSIGDLPFLESLSIQLQPNLVGPIQPAIAKLHNLHNLDIGFTNVSGTIPEFLITLPNLLYLSLGANKLTGTIPSSLSKLKHLNSLQLDHNKLTGPIPDSLGSFKAKSFTLFLSHNQLSGRIPPSLSRVDFIYVDLSYNRLEGDASMIFGARKRVRTIDLSKNLFEFNLSKVEFSSNLASLDISQNKIFGGLPPSLSNLDYANFKADFFNVSYNQLCGPIPEGLPGFDISMYFHNKCLCGSPLKSCK